MFLLQHLEFKSSIKYRKNKCIIYRKNISKFYETLLNIAHAWVSHIKYQCSFLFEAVIWHIFFFSFSECKISIVPLTISIQITQQQTRQQQQQQQRHFILKHKQCCLSNIMLWNIVRTPQKNRSYQVKTESKSNFIAHTHCERSQIKCIRASLLLHSIKFYRLNHTHSLTNHTIFVCKTSIHAHRVNWLWCFFFFHLYVLLGNACVWHVWFWSNELFLHWKFYHI